MKPRPFFERSGSPEQARRRLLLISYHFPPDVTVGARRWEKLAHFAAERGWGLDIITRSFDDGTDLSRLEALPGGVRVFGLPSIVLTVERFEHAVWRVYRSLWPLQEERSSVPGTGKAPTTAAPTAFSERPDTLDRSEVRWTLRSPRELLRVYWVWAEFARTGAWASQAATLAGHIIQPGVHVAVVTSGPPHMTHTSGGLLSRRHRLPFVMDMRDPWSLTQRLPEHWASPLWLRLATRYERRAVEQAALIVANTEQARASLATTHPNARDRIIAVMNGSDDEPLPPAPQQRGQRFTIGYAGTIYLDRDPRSLFQGAARMIRELHLSPEDFGIEFMGADLPGGLSMVELARQEGIGEFVSSEPVRPRAEAMAFLARATMLITFPGWNTIAIPAKVFDCVQFDAWLLAVSDRGSATDLLLQGTNADVIPPDDIDGITAVIRKRYEEYRRGVRPTRVAEADRFSRRRQAQILFDAVERLLPQESGVQPRSALASRS